MKYQISKKKNTKKVKYICYNSTHN